MFVGTHKKKKIEKTVGSKRSRVGTNRRWLKMTQTDKEKLQMAKNLVKANNKKIKKALEVVDVWCDDRYQLDIIDYKLMTDYLAKIKKILEEWNSLV